MADEPRQEGLDRPNPEDGPAPMAGDESESPEAVPFAKVYTGGIASPHPATASTTPVESRPPSSFERAYVPPHGPPPLPVAAIYTGPAPTAPPAYPTSYTPPPAAYALVGRPGIVTALGVMCFIVGSLGLLANFFTGCSSSGIIEHTRRGSLVLKAGGGTGAVTAMAATVQKVEGLDDSDRYMILQAMQRKASSAIAPARMRQAEGLLARRGAEIFRTSSATDGPTGGGLSLFAATNDLERAGREYAGTGNKGPDFFRFTEGSACKVAGQMRVWDDHAVYEPAGGGETIRIVVKENERLTGEPIDSAPPPRDPSAPPPPVTLAQGGFAGLDESEWSAVIAQAQRFAGNRINTAQVQALRDELGAPSAARWLTPTTTITGFTTQIKSTVANGDGSVVVIFGTARLALRVDGSMDWAKSTPMTVTLQTPANTPGSAGFGMGSTPVFIANTTALKLAMGEAIASAVLAALLFWFGALLFQQSRWTRRALFGWAVAKILIGAAGLWALVTARNSLDMLDPGSNGMGNYLMASLRGGATTSVVLASIGLLFPVAILIALKTRDGAKIGQ